MVPSELKKTLENYFAAELAGLSLKEVKNTTLEKSLLGTPRWFRGRGNSSVYFTQTDKGTVTTFEIIFLGHVIEGGRSLPTRHGTALQTERSNLHEKNTRIQFIDGPLPLDTFENCQKLLEQIADIDARTKQQLLNLIKGDHHDS
jgi:hypothetical protein